MLHRFFNEGNDVVSIFLRFAAHRTEVHAWQRLTRVEYGLNKLICTCRYMTKVLDECASETGLTAWRLVYLYNYWSPAPENALVAWEKPAGFSWKTECSMGRPRLTRTGIRIWNNSANFDNEFLVHRRFWVLPGRTPYYALQYTYNVENLRSFRGIAHEDIADASDTVAVIHGRAVDNFGPTLRLHDVQADHVLEKLWNPRLPGGRRLRYYELEVKDPGMHGYISCGAVHCREAKRLRLAGAQPGWGGMGSLSVAYHGDDGKIYPGRHDTFEMSSGEAFGPCFTKQEFVNACLSGAVASPGDAAPRPNFIRGMSVCGVGMDLDRDLFFFTLNGALVGEIQKEELNPAHCVLAVGLHSPGESVLIHLGLDGFWFPTEQYSLDALSVPRWQNPRQWSQR